MTNTDLIKILNSYPDGTRVRVCNTNDFYKRDGVEIEDIELSEDSIILINHEGTELVWC